MKVFDEDPMITAARRRIDATVQMVNDASQANPTMLYPLYINIETRPYRSIVAQALDYNHEPDLSTTLIEQLANRVMHRVSHLGSRVPYYTTSSSTPGTYSASITLDSSTDMNNWIITGSST